MFKNSRYVRVARGKNTIAVETMVETADVVEDPAVECRIKEFVEGADFAGCETESGAAFY